MNDSINALPPRLSFCQDYYGYFNGKSSNTSLLPTNTAFNSHMSAPSLGSNRSVDTVYSKKGMLTKINYPTGGFSKIEYQSNYISKYKTFTEVFDTVDVSINYNSSSFLEYSPQFNCSSPDYFPYKLTISAEWITPPDYNGPLIDSNVSLFVVDASSGSCLFLCSVNVYPGETLEYNVQLNTMPQYGPYKLKLETGNPDIRAKAQFLYFHQTMDTLLNSPRGGVRVAAIRNYTDSNLLAGYKKFNYNDSLGVSTGTGLIDYDDKIDFCYVERKILNPGDGEWLGANYVLSSSSILGGYINDYAGVNYEYVTEEFDSLGASGKITTQFLLGKNTIATAFACGTPGYVFDHMPTLLPNVPQTNTGYMNGKEYKKTTYKTSNGSFKKLSESVSHYSTDSRLYNVDSFFVMKQDFARTYYGVGWLYFYDYQINKYKRISAWVHVDSTVEKSYDASDNELKVKTVYNYDNSSHMLPTLVWHIGSTGDTLKKVTKYTDDLRQADPGNLTLYYMVENNMSAIPLKNQLYSNSNLLKTSLMEYNSALLPASLKTASESNSLELEAEFTQYDATGNPQEFKSKGSIKSLLTDTATGLMTAGCDNAAFSDIAYTSFETGYAGNWSGISSSYVQSSGGLTGDKYYNKSSFSLSKSGLTTGTYYMVTYWSKNGSYSISGTQTGFPKTVKTLSHGGGSWTLYEHMVTGQSTITVTGSGALDELRLHPQKAFMTSYTYTPLVGINSQCDATNRIAYYEYDNFGRLKLIRDQDNIVLKKYDYKYASH